MPRTRRNRVAPAPMPAYPGTRRQRSCPKCFAYPSQPCYKIDKYGVRTPMVTYHADR